MGLLLVGLCRHDCSRLQQNPAAERTISCSPLEGKSWFLFPSLPAQPPKPIVLSLAICLSISLTSYLSFIFFFFGRHFFFISSTFIFLTFISASLFLTLIFFANVVPPISYSMICCWLCPDFWPLSHSDSRGTDRNEAGAETGKTCNKGHWLELNRGHLWLYGMHLSHSASAAVSVTGSRSFFNLMQQKPSVFVA